MEQAHAGSVGEAITSALQAYKQILKINPYQEGAKEAVDELSVEVEGQGI